MPWLALLCLLLVWSPAAEAVPVTLELALLLDVSGSIDDGEYAQQKAAYVNAFQDPAIHALIAALPGGIAVTYIEWSGDVEQSQVLAWTQLTGAASANAFASSLNATLRAFSGGATAPGSALDFAMPLFASNGFEGTRSVIDISGDGAQNTGSDTATAAAAALAGGIRVNGLVVLGEAGVQDFYQNSIVTPGGGFLIVADGFDDLEVALNRKLQFEIPGQSPEVPEPGTGLLAIAGLGILLAFRYRG
ncbi:MAG: DUF1194 domain-containing protein [Bryobacteraceae bacterium]|nr:DUF1194 domain-containing protein [Bryobacteraceae bacterium]